MSVRTGSATRLADMADVVLSAMFHTANTPDTNTEIEGLIGKAGS